MLQATSLCFLFQLLFGFPLRQGYESDLIWEVTPGHCEEGGWAAREEGKPGVRGVREDAVLWAVALSPAGHASEAPTNGEITGIMFATRQGVLGPQA